MPHPDKDAGYWIRTLRLSPHAEGGYFRELFAASDSFQTVQLPGRYTGPRKAYTSIYFLLKSGEVSRLHRLKSDELWNFYSGSPISLHVLDPEDGYRLQKLGPDPEENQAFQRLVGAGCWFGATVDRPESYSLAGCFVSPGFDYADFELGQRKALLKDYPDLRPVINRLTKP